MVGGWAEGVGAGAGLVAAAAAGRAWLAMRRRARLDAVAREVTGRYARLLTVKRNQLVIHDGYGNYDLEPWIDHVEYFIGNVVLREAGARGLRVGAVARGTPAWSRLTRVLLAVLSAREEDEDGSPGEAMSGRDYEALCGDLMRARGWHVDATPATGDQGADLIAEVDGCRVIVQCKFYGKPVGNKAVQEVHAAMGFHAGDRAVVVSNASFTRSARQLAGATGVLLLHHDQLRDLDGSLGEGRRRA